MISHHLRSILFLGLTPTLISAHQGAFAPLGKRDLDKPVVSPDFYESSLEPALAENLQSPGYSIDVWSSDQIPQHCAEEISGQQIDGKNLTIEDVEVFTVVYDGCDTSWTMCRHPSANVTNDDVASVYGKLPNGLRAFNRHIMVAAETDMGAGAYSGRGNLFVFGNLIQKFSVYGHESAHSLDWQVQGDGTHFSDTDTWMNAFESDSAVVKDYAQTSQYENFAETVNVALYDLNVDGGISNIAENWEDFQNQLRAITDNLGDRLRVSDTCVPRTLENSETVEKDSVGAAGAVRSSVYMTALAAGFVCLASWL